MVVVVGACVGYENIFSQSSIDNMTPYKIVR